MTWQTALAEIAKTLQPSTLEAVVIELELGVPRMVHRVFTEPPPIHALCEARCCAACLLGFMAMCEGAVTVAQVQDWIVDLGLKVGSALTARVMAKWDGEPHDPAPEERDRQVRLEVLAEVRAIIGERA